MSNTFKWSAFQRSPKVGQRVLGLNGDELNFKKFRNSLQSRKLNSTTVSVSGDQRNQYTYASGQVKIITTHGGIPNDSLQALIAKKHDLLEKLANMSAPQTEAPIADPNPNPSPNPAPESLEEGELVTDDDGTKRTIETNVVDDDDDCVFVEQQIEEIIIDDTTEIAPIFCEDITGDISDDTLIDLTPARERKSFRASKSNRNSPAVEANDVIVLDDTVDMQETPTTKRVTRQSIRDATLNQSVVFVSETWPDFIPLVSNNVPNPIKEPKEEAENVPKNSKKSQDSFFTKSEKKQLEVYNANAYNPNSTEEKNLRKQNPKRLVIVDGSNVAFAHSRNEFFSVRGLKICIEHFQKMGHEVKAVIPLFRTHKQKSSDPDALDKMHKDGIVVLTPCKNIPGHYSSSYDDRFILQLASELDAAIVSNDNYRDLINENKAFKRLIENRVVGYTWCDDVFILPKDPYGKFGPQLHSILNRQV